MAEEDTQQTVELATLIAVTVTFLRTNSERVVPPLKILAVRVTCKQAHTQARIVLDCVVVEVDGHVKDVDHSADGLVMRKSASCLIDLVLLEITITLSKKDLETR